ncbi:MAG: hypothetical protein AAGE01_20135 [Pseudomonadota bacterium]
MSLHTAKAHFTNAQNYAQSEFEKQLALGLAAMASAMGDRHNELASSIRSLQQLVQNQNMRNR